MAAQGNFIRGSIARVPGDTNSNSLQTLFTDFDCKGKEEYLYSAILADTPPTKRSDMDHTVLPANYTMSAFPS